MKFVHEYKEKEYITFEVATLRNEDQFGHTHTVYVTTVEETEEAPKPEEDTRNIFEIESDYYADKQEMESNYYLGRSEVEYLLDDDLPF